MSDDSIGGAVAAGMAAGFVTIILLAVALLLVFAAGSGVSFILNHPTLKGIMIGAFGTLGLVTAMTAVFYEGDTDD